MRLGKKLKLNTLLIPLLLTGWGCGEKPVFSVVVMSDLHYDSTEVRRMVLDSMIDRVNGLGKATDRELRSVVALGDLTDDGSAIEWQQFLDDFGLTGDKKLRLPIYEMAGNHDGNVDGVIRNDIRKRNLDRLHIKGISETGLHYSWEDGGIHFVSLGIYPGLQWDSSCGWCHYFKESFRDPEMSLAFLEQDLQNNLGNHNQPVVLFFHYGWDEFSLLWWTEEEQERFYSVIKDYNILGIFHGHDHAIDHYLWKDFDVWSAGSPQRDSLTGDFLLLNFERDSMKVQVVNYSTISDLGSKPINFR